MKEINSIKIILIFIMILSIGTSVISKPIPDWPIKFSFEPIDELKINEMVRFELQLTPSKEHLTCDFMDISMEEVNGLIIYGISSFTLPFVLHEAQTQIIEFVIPDNDTSRIALHISCDDYKFNIVKTFVTTSDTVELIDGIPTVYSLPPEIQAQIKASQDSSKRSQNQPLLVSPESGHGNTYTKEEIQLMKMKKLEREPLMDKDEEYFLVGKELYIRHKGENNFEKNSEYIKKKTVQQTRDRINNIYDVVLYLKDQSDYNYAASQIDSLIPTDSTDWYRVFIKRPILIDLIDNEITYKTSRRFLNLKKKDQK